MATRRIPLTPVQIDILTRASAEVTGLEAQLAAARRHRDGSVALIYDAQGLPAGSKTTFDPATGELVLEGAEG